MYNTADSERMTVDRAERILASILVNHDSVPALVMLTATLVSENGQPFTYAQAKAIMQQQTGTTFDADGEIVWTD